MGFRYNKGKPPLILLDVDKLTVCDGQPRQHFDEASLVSLSESMKQNGLLQPLTVRKTTQGYILVAGERRLRAAKLAGMKKLPCLVVQADQSDGALLSILENLQRENLTCFEEARAISRLMEEWGFSREDVSARLGVAASTLSNTLRLLQLTPWQQERIVAAGLSGRHARALLQLAEEDLRNDVLMKVIAEDLTVAQTEQLVRKELEKRAPEPTRPKRKTVIGDLRLFANTIQHAVATMQRSGVAAKSQKTENEWFIEYKITIPKLPEDGLGEQLKLFV